MKCMSASCSRYIITRTSYVFKSRKNEIFSRGIGFRIVSTLRDKSRVIAFYCRYYTLSRCSCGEDDRGWSSVNDNSHHSSPPHWRSAFSLSASTAAEWRAMVFIKGRLRRAARLPYFSGRARRKKSLPLDYRPSKPVIAIFFP